VRCWGGNNGFSASALTGWPSKLRHRPASRTSAAPFVAVVRKDTAPAREVVVEVAGARMRVTQGFDPALSALAKLALRGEDFGEMC
jgi:hypothetical protein